MLCSLKVHGWVPNHSPKGPTHPSIPVHQWGSSAYRVLSGKITTHRPRFVRFVGTGLGVFSPVLHRAHRLLQSHIDGDSLIACHMWSFRGDQTNVIFGGMNLRTQNHTLHLSNFNLPQNHISTFSFDTTASIFLHGILTAISMQFDCPAQPIPIPLQVPDMCVQGKVGIVDVGAGLKFPCAMRSV